MRNLIEMCNLISPHRVKNIELFDKALLSKKGEKLNQLYTGIVKGRFKSDNDAAIAIYQADSSDGNYKSLKSGLKKRLLNNIFFLDIEKSSFSDYHQAKLSCSKMLACATILSTYGARDTAMKVAKQTLSQAAKYDLNVIVIACARILKDYYTLIGELKEYQSYSDLIRQHQGKLQADILAEDYYQDLIIHYIKSVSSKAELANLAKRYLRELKPHSKKYKSYTLHYYMYRIEGLMHKMTGNYRAALKAYQGLIKYLEGNRSFYNKKLLANINIYMIDCYVNLHDFKKGETAAKVCEEVFPPGHINWFIFNESNFILTIRSSNFIKAHRILNEVMGNLVFENLPPDRKEKWKIFEAYFNFILETKKTGKEIPKRPGTSYFDVEAFIKEVPIFSKDKRGFNVAILIIHILFMLRKERFGEIIDRMDSLKVYHSRHLKREEDRRSKLFIKMLLIMEKNSFDYSRVKPKTDKYYQQLVGAKFMYEGTALDAEVIPYEELWRIVLMELKGN